MKISEIAKKKKITSEVRGVEFKFRCVYNEQNNIDLVPRLIGDTPFELPPTAFLTVFVLQLVEVKIIQQLLVRFVSSLCR